MDTPLHIFSIYKKLKNKISYVDKFYTPDQLFSIQDDTIKTLNQYFNNLGNSNINPYLSEKNTWFQKQSGIILSILFFEIAQRQLFDLQESDKQGSLDCVVHNYNRYLKLWCPPNDNLRSTVEQNNARYIEYKKTHGQDSIEYGEGEGGGENANNANNAYGYPKKSDAIPMEVIPYQLERVFSSTYMRRDIMSPYKKNPAFFQWTAYQYKTIIIYDNSTDESVDTEHLFCAYNGDGASDDILIEDTNCISNNKLKDINSLDNFKAVGGLGCKKSKKKSCFLCDHGDLTKCKKTDKACPITGTACNDYYSAFKDKSRFKKFRQKENIDPFNEVVVKTWNYNPKGPNKKGINLNKEDPSNSEIQPEVYNVPQSAGWADVEDKSKIDNLPILAFGIMTPNADVNGDTLLPYESRIEDDVYTLSRLYCWLERYTRASKKPIVGIDLSILDNEDEQYIDNDLNPFFNIAEKINYKSCPYTKDISVSDESSKQLMSMVRNPK